ncbi:hypothetical protein V7S43_016664 [Phytophthora oleae]|uniref:Uncharacterized protein n=1 Tax=Phytophthora oleae TaxID=2107226 RepID=A0ABD3EUS3_9STRA
MMTEAMMCVQLLAQLPSEIWASSIVLMKEAFITENVDNVLNKLFCDRSKTMICGATEVARINHVKKERKMRGYPCAK